MTCVIFRGPSGVGKSTTARKFTEAVDGVYISFDELIFGSELSCRYSFGPRDQVDIAGDRALRTAQIAIEGNKVPVFDWLFDHEGDLQKFLGKINTRLQIPEPLVISLKANFHTCLTRNTQRPKAQSQETIWRLHKNDRDIHTPIEIHTDFLSPEETLHEALAYFHNPKRGQQMDFEGL